jgi:hypothetical protein
MYASCSVMILGPNGSLESSTIDCSHGSAFVGPVILQTTGIHSIFVYTQQTSGTATLQVNNIPSEATASTAIGASPVTLTTTIPGQAANITFSATAGQTATIQLSGNTMSAVAVKLFGIDGSILNSINSGGSSFTIPSTNLPYTGIYEIQIVPNQANVGSITVAVTP